MTTLTITESILDGLKTVAYFYSITPYDLLETLPRPYLNAATMETAWTNGIISFIPAQGLYNEFKIFVVYTADVEALIDTKLKAVDQE